MPLGQARFLHFRNCKQGHTATLALSKTLWLKDTEWKPSTIGASSYFPEYSAMLYLRNM